MMPRLVVVILIVAAVVAGPVAAGAQPAAKTVRIGYLGLDPAPSPYLEAFRAGLRRLGYIEGRNITIEARLADGHADRLPALARELVTLNVAVIVGTSGSVAQAARNATATIPIVVGVSGDPVEAGLVASLPRPGGNITGMTYLQPELGGKRLQTLKEIAPQLTRIAVLRNPVHAGEDQEWREMDTAAKRIGVTLQNHMVRSRDLTEIFAAITRDRAEAILMVPGPMTNILRKPIAEFGLKARLPVIGGWSEYAEAGSLVSYGPSRRDVSRRLASFVDRILRGEKPADLPVERPTRFELVVNLRTAKAVGVAIPPSLLLQADEVIE
ncbi:MAG TPA: ABC transporter substrate-binding protein [Candidatus Limnocylindria bacterium]|nr:ABC transporter substrate-binding protein [Candidatus Limnocylindria bacterium]